MTDTTPRTAVPRHQLPAPKAATRLVRHLATGAAFLVCSQLAWAQKNEQQSNWYQIEVIIFERLAPSRAEDPEIWPKDIELAYPNNWRKLIEPETAAEWLEELEQDSEATQPPVSPADATQSGLDARTASRESGSTPPDPLTRAEDTPLAPQDYAQAQSTKPEPLPPLLDREDHREYAFVRLARSERTLNESSSAISRDRGMRVLFHEAWRQPLNTDIDAPALIVRGGNEYGAHTELEGSLHLSISRYLHLQTNLWLTQFIPNYGQESEHWPALPTVPTRQQAQAEAEQENSELLLGETQSAWDIQPQLPEDYTALIDRPFLVNEIVTLKQARRMRSGELHYIDHPRVGLLIKVDTYQPLKDKKNSNRSSR